MNIVIPVLGEGKRFKEAGYEVYKALLPVGDTNMLGAVMRNVTPNGKHRFLVLTPDQYPQKTEGAACSVLLVKELIDSDDQLLIVNSDQLLDWDINYFLTYLEQENFDAGIVTFKATDSKWSYAALAANNDHVSYTVEKPETPPSDQATVGVYYWKHGRDFVKSAERMIEDGFRVRGEFYVCPSFNWLPRDKKIALYEIAPSEMHGLGTPEDYESYIATL
jgi:dTDP-glucose pyrophosphorylase